MTREINPLISALTGKFVGKLRVPLTIEQVLNARMVSYPFTVRDCCLVTDGGGAIIMTSAARAKSLKKPPAYVLGCGHGVTHMNMPHNAYRVWQQCRALGLTRPA